VDVKYSPDVAENLLSLRKFTDNGYVVTLTSGKLKIINPRLNTVLIIGKYVPPNWLVKLELINPAEITNYKFYQDIKGNTQYLIEEILETGGVEEMLDSGGTSTADSKEEIKLIENEKAVEDEAENERNLTNEKIDEPKEVIPKLDKTRLELDRPKFEIKRAELNEEEFEEETREPELNIKNCKDSIGMKWHRRLGHASLQYLLELQKSDPILKDVKFDESINECDICRLTKMARLPHSETRTRAIKPLQIIHSDVMGPLKPVSQPNKLRFIVVFIDDYS